MATITALSNDYYDLFFHDDAKIVHHVYKPPMDSAHLQDVLSAGTDLMEKYGAIKWLSDNRLLVNAFSDEAAEWVNTVWLPRTIRAGWKYWAMIVPTSFIGQADHVKFVESFFDKGIWVTVYADLESAMSWIEGR